MLRQIADDILAIPVGAMALELSGMVMLNPVSKVIWQCLEQETDLQTVCQAVTDRFEVSPEEALQDAEEFIQQLRAANLLAE